MSNKGLIDIIDDMLNESIADDINKITADNVKDGANLKPVGDKSSADTQGVQGQTSGAAMDAGGDKDVGPSGKKGHFPSQASSDTQGVLGTTSGSAMDAGGDTDVGGSKGDNPSDASPDTQGILGKTSGAALDAGGDKDLGKLKEDTEEEWSFIDEETGEELSEEEVEEFAEWVADNFELDEDLEEMMLGSKAGTKQSKSHIMKKAISRQAGAGEDGNKKISLAGPGGKKITATKTGSREPGQRYKANDGTNDGKHFKKVNMEDYSDVEFTEEDIQQLVDEGFDLDEIMEFFETEELEEADAAYSAKNKRTSDKNFEPTTASNIQNKSAEKKIKDAEAKSAKPKSGLTIAQRKAGMREELEMRIEAMCASKKKKMNEAQGEKLEKITSDANRAMRPDQEKDVNPQNHGGDPMGSKTGAALDAGGDKDAAPAGKKGQYPSEASADTQGVLGKTKGAALDAGGDKDVGKLKEDEDELEEKLHGDQHKLDHNDNGKIDASDMKTVRKKGATAHLNKEEVEDEEALIDEDFKAKAEVIFEAAVGEKVNLIKEELKVQYDEYLQEEINDLNEKVAQFVEEAVEEWLEENALEVRYSLRTEVAENFITGLKGLFEESYIEIPEEEYSVVDELTESVEEQKQQIDNLMEELKEAKMFILESKKQEVLNTLSEDLTQTQAVRLEKLAEGLEAEDVKEFEEKVMKLKEGYFDSSSEQPLMSLTEEVFTGAEQIVEDNDSSVSQYAKFLSKTVLK